MNSLEPEIVLRKLEFLDNYLSQLETIGSISLEDYLNSQITQLAVERLLQLIIQAALDTNRYLLKN
ncbi:MAG: DUF86 domain-containing protein [Richelia sp. SM2_1_7]|nr:DUF86 domain-containing protein [Richelia sp. SM2_1_7]